MLRIKEVSLRSSSLNKFETAGLKVTTVENDIYIES